MTDKELRRLSRSELMDIIYTLRKNQDTLERMNAELKERLASRELKIKNAGSIAEAALAVSKVFEDAQKAADLYLEELKRRGGDIDINKVPENEEDAQAKKEEEPEIKKE